MKRIYFSIILLLAALPKGAGQSVEPKAIDLAVTMEIVHTVKSPERLLNTTPLIPYLRLSVHNQAKHPRNVTFMSCSWNDSWTQKGAYGLCGAWLCEKNVSMTISIPAGKALVFYGLMCGRQSGESRTGSFSMGFIDYTQSHFSPLLTKEEGQKSQKSPTVYWSNEVNGRINIANTPELAAPHLEQSYSLEAGR